MALATGNLVTPQQTALNNKLNPSPFSTLMNAPMRPMPQAGSAPFTQPLSTPNIGGAINSAAGAVGNAFNSMKPAPTSRPSYLPPAPMMNLAGLLTPPQPTLGTVGSTPVTSHTVTTKPDGTTTHKVTHATPEDTVSTQGSSGASVTPPSSTTPQYDPAGGGGHAIVPQSYTPQAIAGATPITGDTTTPSGAIVNATTGQPSFTPPQASGATFPGLVSSAANSAQGNTAIGQNAANIADQYGQQYADVGRKGANAESGYLTTGTSPVAEGNAAVQVQNTAAQQQAIAQGEQAALQGTGQQLTAQNQQTNGLIAAGGLIQPTQVPYSNQYIDPTTGQPVGGGATGTLPAQAQTFVNSIAQQVQNGQMTRDEAASQLNAYGPAGLQALNTALGPNFNTNASNASAGTTATGQQIAAAIPPANQALDALQTAFSNLPALQSSGIPLLNQLTQNVAMATGIGRDQASAFQGALQEARSRIDAALVGSIGVDAASKQASTLLPDNMVPSEIPQKIAAAKQYLQNQLTGYSNSGQQNPTVPTQNGGSLYSF